MIHCLLYILSEVLMNTSYALETENKNLKTTWGTSLEFGTFCCKQWVISFLFRVIAAGKSRRMDRLIQEREAALPLKPQMRQSPEELFKVNRAFVSGDGFSPVHSFDFLLHCCTWVLWYTKTFFMNSPFFPPFFVFVSSTFHCIWALALDKTIYFFRKMREKQVLLLHKYYKLWSRWWHGSMQQPLWVQKYGDIVTLSLFLWVLLNH